MSHSYKKAVYKDNNCKKLDKRLAAKAVRNTLDVLDGSWYKRVYNSYNINDYSSYEVFAEELFDKAHRAKWTTKGWHISK